MSTSDLLLEVRELEDEVDALKCLIQDFDKFLIGYNVNSDVEDREIGELQERIRSCFEDDEDDEDGDETDEFDNDDPDAQTDKEVQTEHWNSERLSE